MDSLSPIVGAAVLQRIARRASVWRWYRLNSDYPGLNALCRTASPTHSWAIPELDPPMRAVRTPHFFAHPANLLNWSFNFWDYRDAPQQSAIHLALQSRPRAVSVCWGADSLCRAFSRGTERAKRDTSFVGLLPSSFRLEPDISIGTVDLPRPKRMPAEV